MVRNCGLSLDFMHDNNNNNNNNNKKEGVMDDIVYRLLPSDWPS